MHRHRRITILYRFPFFLCSLSRKLIVHRLPRKKSSAYFCIFDSCKYSVRRTWCTLGRFSPTVFTGNVSLLVFTSTCGLTSQSNSFRNDGVRPTLKTLSRYFCLFLPFPKIDLLFFSYLLYNYILFFRRVCACLVSACSINDKQAQFKGDLVPLISGQF